MDKPKTKLTHYARIIISLILALTITILAVPAFAADFNPFAYTNNTVIAERLQSLLNEYKPNEEYFTSTPWGEDKNGNKKVPCSNDLYGGYTYDEERCGHFDSMMQCRGYAMYAQYVLFGKTERGKTNSTINGASDIKYTWVYSPNKSDIMKMPLGTHIRNDDYDTMHSIILLKTTDSQISYLDCNCSNEWDCAVHLHTVSWDRFFSYYGIGVSYIYSGYATYPSSSTYPKDKPYGQTPFTDIGNHWARKEIETGYLNGIVNGVSNSSFAPNEKMTRAMFVQTLYNLADNPSSPKATFDDIPDNAWYANAVGWAEHNNIITGTGNGNFSPNLSITREESAQILFNLMSGGVEGLPSLDILSEFKDSSSISSWATYGMAWAVENKIILGRDDNSLAPKENLTRAESVTLLLRFINSSDNLNK